jgi:hypothetical protein
VTTGACLQDMRWLVITLVACSHAPPTPAPLSARHDLQVEITPATELIQRDERLVELPPLPAKRGIDIAGDQSCRAHLAAVQRYDARTHDDDLQRLIRVATLTGGDCRIDADALLAEAAPIRIGGCMGASIEDAKLAWTRVALVATTRARRAAALRNVATLAWDAARFSIGTAAWIAAGDAYVKASDADRDALDLSTAAVDGYENALRVPFVQRTQITRANVAHIAGKLGAILDGPAADRARAIRARLR